MLQLYSIYNTLGFYGSVLVPFGLMNASTVFQRYMKQYFQENHDDFIVPYIDLKTSHIGNMRLALQRLQQHLVNKIKAKKCQLFKQEVRYFSRTVAAGGYRLGTNNI